MDSEMTITALMTSSNKPPAKAKYTKESKARENDGEDESGRCRCGLKRKREC